MAELGFETVPTVVVDGRPVVTGFYDARRLARALNLNAEAWGVPAPRPPQRRRTYTDDLDRVARATAAAVRLIPDQRLDDRPEEAFWSLRELAYHSYAFNNRLMRAHRFGEPMTWPAVNAYVKESLAYRSSRGLAEAGLDLHDRFRAWLEGTGPAAWDGKVMTFSGEQEAEDMLFFALGHMAFHLVQLYRYLDLIGAGSDDRLPVDGLLALNEPATMGGGTNVGASEH